MDAKLPLDIDPEADILSLPGPELQRSTIRALRLEHNWRRNSSRLNGITRINHGDIIDQMQFIGSEWLVTLSRDSRSAFISVWYVGRPTKAHRIAFLDVPLAMSFSASLQNAGSQAIVAVISGTE